MEVHSTKRVSIVTADCAARPSLTSSKCCNLMRVNGIT